MTQAENLSLKEHFTNVRTKTLEMAQRDEKHLLWGLVIKIIILAFITFYLGWAWANLKVIDANFLVLAAQTEIKDSLPMAKKNMSARLTEMAPDVVNQIFEGMMINIPQISSRLESTLKSTSSSYLDSVEKDFLGWLTSFMQEKKMVIDEMFPDMPSYQKLTTMRQYLIEDFQVAMEGVSYEIDESVSTHPFRDKLRHLAAGKNLTEKEKLQRDIIALWYVLIQKKTADLDLGKTLNIR